MSQNGAFLYIISIYRQTGIHAKQTCGNGRTERRPWEIAADEGLLRLSLTDAKDTNGPRAPRRGRDGRDTV